MSLTYTGIKRSKKGCLTPDSRTALIQDPKQPFSFKLYIYVEMQISECHCHTARLTAISSGKLSYTGKEVTKVDTYKIKAGQYDPSDGSFTKKDRKDRMIELGKNTIVQRDLLSAYIPLPTTEAAAIDTQSAQDDFRDFKALNDKEVERLRLLNRLSRYVK